MRPLPLVYSSVISRQSQLSTGGEGPLALENIKQERRDAVLKVEEEKRRVKESERERKEGRRETRERNRPDLPYLIQLESFFWECVRDFSALSGLKVARTNRSLLYPLLSSPTINRPELRVDFEVGHMDHHILLSLRGTHRLCFDASRAATSRHSGTRYYGYVSAELSLHPFNLESAKKWLDNQFEKHFKTLDSSSK